MNSGARDRSVLLLMEDWKDAAEMRQDGDDIHQFIEREFGVVHNSS